MDIAPVNGDIGADVDVDVGVDVDIESYFGCLKGGVQSQFRYCLMV